MNKLAQWLKDNRICHTMAAGTCLIFDPPPVVEHAHGAAASWASNGKDVARLLRARGWAACSTANENTALSWYISLGYERATAAPPVLKVPAVAVLGSSKINLTVVAARVVANPRITTRELAKEMSAAERRPIDYGAVNRAMIAVGWGPGQREAFRAGAIPAPVLEPL